MTIVHECIPCQYGMHDEHADVPDPGDEGVIGGRWECHCKGECRDRPRPKPIVGDPVDINDEAFALLRRFGDAS